MMVGEIWLYALLMVIPTISGNLGYNTGLGKFGNHSRLGKCEYIDGDFDVDLDDHLRTIFYSFEFGVPFILIVVSYFGIWSI